MAASSDDNLDHKDVVFKCSVMVGLFFLGLLGGWLPKVVSDQNRRMLCILNTGSGGVLLAAGFMHLLPDAADDLQSQSDRVGFPLAYLFASGGFIIVLCAEELAVSFKEKHDERRDRVMTDVMNASIDALATRQSLHSEPEMIEGGSVSKRDDDNHDHRYNAFGHDHEHEHEWEVASTALDGAGDGVGSRLSAAVLFLALALHSVLEGLGFGTASHSSGVLVALAAHKALAAFSLGSSLTQAQVPFKQYLQVIVSFSAVTPVGIAIGIAISAMADSSVSAYFVAMAAGTFIYVSTAEIIPTELAKPHDKNKKLGCMLAGYGLMAMLALWV